MTAAGLPGSRRRLLLQLWAALVLLLGVRAFADGVAAVQERLRPAPWQPWRIDLNRARTAELMALPGIGESRAEAIVLHRLRHGPFRSIDELDAVDGIGGDTLAALRAHAFVQPR